MHVFWRVFLYMIGIQAEADTSAAKFRLLVTCVGARDLKNLLKIGKQSPYAKLKLGSQVGYDFSSRALLTHISFALSFSHSHTDSQD